MGYGHISHDTRRRMESGAHLGAVWVGAGTLGARSLKVEVEGGGLLSFLVGVV
jgi:hypothetical protein